MAVPTIALDTRSPEAVDGRQIRAVAFQEVRLAYVSGVLNDHGLVAVGRRALVVGSGRGLLARGLAGLGFEVTAVDPSPTATAMAREADDGAAVEYHTAPAEDPRLPEAAFDLAYYADTFEITSDLDRVVGHASRALKPDGLLVYDTVNRTLPSRLVYLLAFQTLPMTRIMPAGRYASARLRTPGEMTAALARHGLRNDDVCGFKPRRIRNLVTATLARRRGEITDDGIPAMADFVLDPHGRPVVTYLGHARKV
ncbi:class I SAM-dependent methyltransferase [Sphaerisporangium fuscum]|uniref:class I SAM-dependent methyltransferase n=1 Tax=Sphaerisporangium fuscum TaxID=2835868 RepID=UPI001BDCB5CF|nr:class I SAM-dependent methyltransferase [Sphaerisporangium fuscum]